MLQLAFRQIKLPMYLRYEVQILNAHIPTPSYINASLRNEEKLRKTEKRRYMQYLGELLIEKIRA